MDGRVTIGVWPLATVGSLQVTGTKLPSACSLSKCWMAARLSFSDPPLATAAA